jgi:hypothetical protein
VSCAAAGRGQEAISRLHTRIQALEQVLSGNHIETVSAVLDWIEVSSPGLLEDQFGSSRFNSGVQNAAHNLQTMRSSLVSSLGQQHPVSLRVLRMQGQVTALLGDYTKASDILQQALITAEDAFGPNHPLTIEIVEAIGQLKVKSSGILGVNTIGGQTLQAVPWLKRALDWKEPRFGIKNGSVKGLLHLLGMVCMTSKNWSEAEEYFEKLSNAYAGDNSADARQAAQNLQSCKTITGIQRMNNARFRGQDTSSTLTGILSQLRF